MTKDCTAPEKYRLRPDQRERVKREEIKWGQIRDRNRERRAEKQLGDHGAKIPTVKSSLPPQPAAAVVAKRKRDEGIPAVRDTDRTKVPRVSNSNIDDHNRGQRGSNAPQSSIAQPGSVLQPPLSAPSGASLAPRPPTGASGRPGMMPGQQMVRKKKANADDMFVKKR